MSANFDRIARPYRWLEYLTLGRALERMRLHHLAALSDCRHALILGDGDGRFTASLLRANPSIHVDAVDSSRTMLHLLERRCTPSRNRLTLHHADARTFIPAAKPDVIVTHFFLDCLHQAELDTLLARLAPSLTAPSFWLVSDFRIPSGWLRWPATAYIRMLYLAFEWLTALKTTQLPNHASALHQCGFRPIARHYGLFGILTTELWQRSTPPPIASRQSLPPP